MQCFSYSVLFSLAKLGCESVVAKSLANLSEISGILIVCESMFVVLLVFEGYSPLKYFLEEDI